MKFEHIRQHSQAIIDEAVEHRRDLHQHPELGWTEFRTASRAAAMLHDAGWDVAAGLNVIEGPARMGVPDQQVLEEAWDYALKNGGELTWMEPMSGGFTGVVATLDSGKPGPTIALRFDIDALPIHETSDTDQHPPARAGFTSRRPGVMHACGHDAHSAIGVGVARVLSGQRGRLSGRIKVILQPAEEGARGAASIVATGVLDDVDYFLCPHVGAECLVFGKVIPGATGFLATEKIDVTFTGAAAHAGLAPQAGRNALLGAAQAVLGLHGIARHSSGNSRINVGTLSAGTGRNIIPAEARLKLEVRGDNNEVLQYLSAQAGRIVDGAGAMYGLETARETAGYAPNVGSHPDLIARVAGMAARHADVTSVDAPIRATASDDATTMMDRVLERGGQASYVFIGTPVGTGHHTPGFDIDERCIGLGIELFTALVLDLAGEF